MLTIRLSRLGRNRKYDYRVILQEKRQAVKGKPLEILGDYHPVMTKDPLVLKKERVEYWVSKGAQPSDTVAVLLKNAGYAGMERFIGPRGRKRTKKGEEAKAAAPAAGAAVTPATNEATTPPPSPAEKAEPAA